MRVNRKRRDEFMATVDAQTMLHNVVKAAETAHRLLGEMSPSSYGDPLSEALGMAVYDILGSVVADDIVQMRLTNALCDIGSSALGEQPEPDVRTFGDPAFAPGDQSLSAMHASLNVRLAQTEGNCVRLIDELAEVRRQHQQTIEERDKLAADNAQLRRDNLVKRNVLRALQIAFDESGWSQKWKGTAEMIDAALDSEATT